jgi:hypothetical protein
MKFVVQRRIFVHIHVRCCVSGKWQLIDCLTGSNCLQAELSALTAWVHYQLQPMVATMEVTEEAGNFSLRFENNHISFSEKNNLSRKSASISLS